MDLSHLIELSDRYSAQSSENSVILPRLSVYRRDAPSDLEALVYEPVICLILRGSKVTSVGDQHVRLRSGDALLVSHHMPVMSRITEASPATPYTAIILSLDLGLARRLDRQLTERPPLGTRTGPLSSGRADPAWLAPLTRYLELMDSPLDAKVVGPSTLLELHYRLLRSPIGLMLRNLLVADSHASRIAKAIHELRSEFCTPLSIANLARTAGMSTSSFHEHFKAVTRTTPIQYQKDLRLIAARALLVEQNQTVSQAAFTVGYESPTHFSRDYSRKFGLPPSKDLHVAQQLSENA